MPSGEKGFVPQQSGRLSVQANLVEVEERCDSAKSQNPSPPMAIMCRPIDVMNTFFVALGRNGPLFGYVMPTEHRPTSKYRMRTSGPGPE